MILKNLFGISCKLCRLVLELAHGYLAQTKQAILLRSIITPKSKVIIFFMLKIILLI